MQKILIFALFFINASMSLQSSWRFQCCSSPTILDNVYVPGQEEKNQEESKKDSLLESETLPNNLINSSPILTDTHLAEQDNNEISKSIPNTISLQATQEKTLLSNTLPPYHTFRQGQKITYQQLPNDIRRIIADYAELNEKANCCSTKLQIAAFNGDFQQVQLLTILGVDLDATNSNYYQHTALMLAVQTSKPIDSDNEIKNKYNIAQYLIWRGANIDKSDPYHKTALHYAVQWQNIAGLRLLLEPQADQNNRNQSHTTPLDVAHSAAMNHYTKPFYRKKDYKIIQILTKYGGTSSIPLEIMPADEMMHKQHQKTLFRYIN